MNARADMVMQKECTNSVLKGPFQVVFRTSNHRHSGPVYTVHSFTSKATLLLRFNRVPENAVMSWLPLLTPITFSAK